MNEPELMEHPAWPRCKTCEHVRIDHAPTRMNGVGPKGRGACLISDCDCGRYLSQLSW